MSRDYWEDDYQDGQGYPDTQQDLFGDEDEDDDFDQGDAPQQYSPDDWRGRSHLGVGMQHRRRPVPRSQRHESDPRFQAPRATSHRPPP